MTRRPNVHALVRAEVHPAPDHIEPASAHPPAPPINLEPLIASPENQVGNLRLVVIDPAMAVTIGDAVQFRELEKDLALQMRCGLKRRSRCAESVPKSRVAPTFYQPARADPDLAGNRAGMLVRTWFGVFQYSSEFDSNIRWNRSTITQSAAHRLAMIAILGPASAQADKNVGATRDLARIPRTSSDDLNRHRNCSARSFSSIPELTASPIVTANGRDRSRPAEIQPDSRRSNKRFEIYGGAGDAHRGFDVVPARDCTSARTSACHIGSRRVMMRNYWLGDIRIGSAGAIRSTISCGSRATASRSCRSPLRRFAICRTHSEHRTRARS